MSRQGIKTPNRPIYPQQYFKGWDQKIQEPQSLLLSFGTAPLIQSFIRLFLSFTLNYFKSLLIMTLISRRSNSLSLQSSPFMGNFISCRVTLVSVLCVGYLHSRSLGHILTNIHKVSQAELENTHILHYRVLCAVSMEAPQMLQKYPQITISTKQTVIYFSKCINEVVIQ